MSSQTGNQIAALHGDLSTHTDDNDGGKLLSLLSD